MLGVVAIDSRAHLLAGSDCRASLILDRAPFLNPSSLVRALTYRHEPALLFRKSRPHQLLVVVTSTAHTGLLLMVSFNHIGGGCEGRGGPRI